MWSFIIASIGITSMWLAGTERTRRIGWALALGQQFVFIAYAIATEQYGFVIGAIVAGSVFARNLWQVRRSE